MNNKLSNIIYMALIAAMYAVLTIMFAPISYGILQFRIADVLQSTVLKDQKYIFGLGLGVFIANMFSNVGGPLDYYFMPLVEILAGISAYYIYKNTKKKFSDFIAMGIFSFIISCGVGIVLYYVLGIPFYIGFSIVFVSQIIINFCGVIIIKKIWDRIP